MKRLVRFITLQMIYESGIFETLRANSLRRQEAALERARREGREERCRWLCERNLMSLMSDLRTLFKLSRYLVPPIYGSLILKYLLMVSLDLEPLASLRWLDCLLLGRFSFVGRVGPARRYFGLVIALGLLFHKSVFLFYRPPHFRYYCLEFLLHGPDQAEARERRAAAGGDQVAADYNSLETLLCNPPRADRCPEAADELEADTDRLYFVQPDKSRPEWDQSGALLRPTRTGRSWRLLARLSIGYLFTLANTLLLLSAFLYFVLLPTISTQMGFELTYRHCVDWLRNHRELAGERFGDSILTAHQLNETHLPSMDTPIFFPFWPAKTDFFLQSHYHSIRFALDLLENVFLWANFLLLASSHFIILILMSAEVIIGTLALSSELRQLICEEQLRRAPSQASCRGLRTPLGRMLDRLGHHSATDTAAVHDSEGHRSIELQRSLIDHLRTIGAYNSNVCFNITFLISFWFTYTLVLCIWTALVGSSAVQREFYITEIASLLMIFVLVAAPAISRTLNFRLYHLLATILALDSSPTEVRIRWRIILSHYQPKPLFCFCFASAELSWMLVLKVSAPGNLAS